MTQILGNSRLKFTTGWKLTLFSLRFAFSLLKYIMNPKRYPLFSLKAVMMFKKNRAFGIHKIPKFEGKYYTAIFRVPRWPSKVYDRMVAGGGLNLGASGTHKKTQIDAVFLGISQSCSYKCEHCYEQYNLMEKKPIPTDRWSVIIDEIQRLGTSIIVLSGGEPIQEYDRTLALLKNGNKELSDFHIQTSGHNVTYEKAQSLKSAGLAAAGISLDDYRPEVHDSFRGFEGAFKNSIDAIRNFGNAGIFPYVNVTLRKELINSGGLWKLLELARRAGAGVIQLLEPKPCGGYTYKSNDILLSDEEKKIVTAFFRDANQNKKYRGFPFVAYLHYYERPEHFGCLMGGLSHFYIDTQGYVQPCVFLPVSFGNILREDFQTIFQRMRKAVPHALHRECAAQHLIEAIRKERIQGNSAPISYAALKNDWKEMYS